MRRTTLGIFFGSLLALAGCVSDTTGSSELELMPESALARTDLVLDESVAAHPLLASDARAQGLTAIPIEVEVFGEVAVAWERFEQAPAFRTREDLVALWERQRFTGVYVTHNLTEAVRLGHRIAVLSRRPGRLREVIAVNRPIADRRAGDSDLDALQARLWDLMKQEALAADQELLDA